jgi:hypothetical protein
LKNTSITRCFNILVNKNLLRYLTICVFLILVFAEGQGQCYRTNTTYQGGEEISYEVYYNWGFIWLNAGFVKFRVADTVYKGIESYFFDSFGSSHKSYDWLFKVRDYYKSYIDKDSLKPLYFHRKNYEGGFEVDNKYTFNWEENLVYSSTWNSKKNRTLDTVNIPDCTYDLLSLIYYTRNLDFSDLEIGEKVPVVSIIDNEIFYLYIRYLGKEKIKHRDGKTYSCFKFSALLVEGTIFKGGEDMFVWVTDDKNRVPVLVEAKILIGSVKAYLKSAKGLKH